MRNVTIKELAADLGVEYAQAAALVHIMVAGGVAQEVGKQPNSRGKGKPSTIYSIPDEYTISLGKAA